jgi:phosphatidylglycerophosphate synthase
MKKENIPNILTIIRFILIPFIFTSVVNEDFLAENEDFLAENEKQLNIEELE